MSKFTIEIITYFDLGKPVVEIYYDSCQWAEISQDGKNMMIKFFPHPTLKHWEFSLEETIKILKKAKTSLLMKRNKGSMLFSEATAKPEEVNKLAEEVLEGILNHPEKKMIQGKLERFGNVVDIYAPNMGGARYTSDGEFIGFLEI